MKQLFKRLGSLALAILMVASLLPLQAFAAEEDEAATVTVPDGFTAVGTLDELKSAFAAGGKIALTADITADAQLKIAKAITVDWNGFTLTLTNAATESNGTSCYGLIVNATATFQDTSKEADGGVYLNGARYTQMIRVASGSSFTINGGKYEINGSAGSNLIALYTWRKTIINGGTFEATNNGSSGAYSVWIADSTTADVTIEGGTYTSRAKAGTPYGIYVASSPNSKMKIPATGGTITVDVEGEASVYGIYNGADTTIANPNLSVECRSTYAGTSNRYLYTLYNGRTIDVSAGSFKGYNKGTSTTVYAYGMSNGRITTTVKNEDGTSSTVEVCQGSGTISGGYFYGDAGARGFGINMNYADTTKGLTLSGTVKCVGTAYAVQPWRGSVNITGGEYHLGSSGVISKGSESTLTVTGGKWLGPEGRGIYSVKSYVTEDYTQTSDGSVRLRSEVGPWINVDGVDFYWVFDSVSAVKTDGTSKVKLLRDHEYYRTTNYIFPTVAEFDLGGYTWNNCRTSGNALTFELKEGATNTHTYIKNGTVKSDSNVAIRISGGTFKLDSVTAQAYVGLGYYETDGVTYDQTKNVVTNCVLTSSPTYSINGYPFSFHLNVSSASQQNVAVYFDNTIFLNMHPDKGAIFRTNSKYGFKGSIYLGENVHMYGGRNQWTSVQTPNTGYTSSLSVYDHTGKKLSNGTFTGSGCLGSNTWTYGDYSNLYLKVTTHGEDVVIPAVPHSCTEAGLLAGAKCAVCGAVTKEQATDPAKHDTIVKVDGKAPTCVEPGWNDYYQCSICQEYFADENAATVIGNATHLESWKVVDGAIPATGAHTAVSHAAKAPSCTEDGNIAYWTCSVCNKFFADAACTEEILESETVDNKTGHSFVNGTCTKCGESACKEGHAWGDKVEAKAATCAAGGYAAHYICGECGSYGDENKADIAYENLLIEIAPNAHTNLQHTEAKAATVYEPGHEEYWFCDGCNTYYSDAGNTEIAGPVVLPQLVAVAQIGAVDKYPSLQAAIDAAAEGDEIDLLTDIYLTVSVKVAKGDVITIDLNGQNVTVGFQTDSTTNHIYWLENRGTLTLKDSVGTGSTASRGLYNYNDLTIENGTYSMLDTNGGAVVFQAKDENVGVDPKLTINDGSFTSAGYTFTIKNGTATYNKGTFVGANRVISNSGKVYIKGGTFHCSSETQTLHTIYNYAGAYTEISGGTIYTGATTTTGTSGTDATAIHNEADGEVKITGGSISAYVTNTSSGARGSGIRNYGKATISGGTLNVSRKSGSAQCYGVRVEGSAETTISGSATIKGASGSINVSGNSTKNSVTTINGGNLVRIYLNKNAQVYINGGTFDLSAYSFEQVLSGDVNGGAIANYHITAATFKTKDRNGNVRPVMVNGLNVEDYVTDKTVAVVTGTEGAVVADTVDKMVTGVNTVGKDGNAVAKLLQNVTDGEVNDFNTSFEMDLNGKTWIQTSGSAVHVKTAGTAKQVTYIHDGYIYGVGSVAISVRAGSMHLKNVAAYGTSTMPVAYYYAGADYNSGNLIEDCRLVTNRFHVFSFRTFSDSKQYDAQPGVGMTFRNTDLINIYNTTGSDGNIFYAGENLTTGTYTLGEGVNMYTIYSGNYNTADQVSEVVTEEGVVIHDQLAAAQYPEVAAVLQHIGQAMGYEEDQIVYGSGTSAAKFVYNPTVYKWTTDHTYGDATCVNGPTCSCGAVNGETDAAAHTGTEEWTKTADKHSKAWTCCGAVTVEEAAHTWKNGTCEICGYGCEHTNTEPVSGKAPTCTETGLTDGEKCTACGVITKEQTEIAIDKDAHTGTEEWTKTADKHSKAWTCCGAVTVEAAAHTWANGQCSVCEYGCAHEHTETLKGYAATCTATGLTDGEKCTACGETTKAQTEIAIDKDAHPADKLEVIPAEEANCEMPGWTEGQKCTACGVNTIEPQPTEKLPHNFAGEIVYCGDGTHKVKCTECAEYDAPVACTEKTVAGKAATCTDKGLTDGTVCSVCNGTIKAQEEIPALGHTEETVKGYAATCTDKGLTDGIKCSVCGEIIKAQEEIPALGHTEETVKGYAATCTDKGLTDGIKCSVCGETIKAQETIPATDHAWNEKSDDNYTAPTTEKDGYWTLTCGNDSSHTQTVVDPGTRLHVNVPPVKAEDIEVEAGELTNDQVQAIINSVVHDNAAIVEKEVFHGSAANDAVIADMKSKDESLKDKEPVLHIELKAMDVKDNKAHKMTFDVTPKLGDTKIELAEAITFYLPVDDHDEGLVNVYHEGELIMEKVAIVEIGGHKYVEVTAVDFSLYTVELYEENPVAKVVSTEYADLQSAIDAAGEGDTVILLDNTTGAGVVINKSITIDFGTYTYTVNEAVGSTGTATLGFQILKGNVVTLKNGTLAATNDVVNGSKAIKMLVQNYADLTLTDITLDGTGSDAMQYVLSNNCGESALTGNTNILAADAVAFDVYDYSAGGYSVPSVSVATTGKIDGKIEVSKTATLAVSGGTFTVKLAEEWCAEGYIPTENSDGTYSVKEGKFVAEVNGTKYETLAEAIAAAEAGQTVTLLANVKSDAAIVIDEAITLDGGNFTLTSTATRAINVNCAGEVKIQDLTIATTANTERAVNVIQKAATLTLDNVTAEGFKYTVNVAASSVGSNITINGGKLSGYAALNITGNNTTVSVNDAELVGVNNVPAHESNNFAVISIGDSTSGNDTTGVSVTVNGGSITATSANGNRQFIVTGVAAEAAEVKVNATLNTVNGDVLNADPAAVTATFPAAYAQAISEQGYAYADNGDGTVTVVKAVAMIGNTGYATLAEAIAAAEAGQTVTLLKSVEIDSLIKIENAITLDLGDNTVTANSKKAFEIYANATIQNGTIIAAQRCVDTRKAVELTLTDVKLEATSLTYGNSQPLTIGGSEHGTKVTITDSEIVAGKYGYGIITFVETQLTAKDSDVSGYMALFVKDGSQNSVFNFAECQLTSDISNNDVEGNASAAIYVVADDITVNVTGGKITATGENTRAFNVGSGVAGTAIVADTELVGKILYIGDIENNSVSVLAKYADQLIAEGYDYETSATDGLINVKEPVTYVAKIGTTEYETLEEAAAAAGNQKTVKLLADCTAGNVAFTQNCTLDLNGFTLDADTITSAKSLTIKGGTLTGETTLKGGVKLTTVTAGDLTVDSGTTNLAAGSTVANVKVQNTGVLTGTFANVTGTITSTAHVLNYGGTATTGYYGNLNNAVTATKYKGYTVVLNADVELTTPIQPVANINLDLNGHNITVAEGCNTAIINTTGLTIKDSTADATVPQGKIVAPVAVQNNAALTVTGGAIIDGDIQNLESGVLTLGTCTINGEIITAAVVKNAKGVVQKYYGSLQAAVTAAGSNYSVVLLSDTALTETLTVAAGKKLTLDLNGKTVSMVYAQDAAANHTMISNSGNLTIQDTAGNGKLSYQYTGASLGTSYAANTITNLPGSVLTVKSGTIENLTYDSGIIAYAIDGQTNGDAGDVTVNIEGGTITSLRQAVRIFANSTTNTGALNIYGGDITGRVIVQNANTNANKAALKIIGGTFHANAYKTDVLYVGGSNGATIAMAPVISGGDFYGEITSTVPEGFIAGGTYSTDVSEYCIAGSGAVLGTDGRYVVKVTDGVAQIGDTQYLTLEDALQVIRAGETLVLLKDIVVESENTWDSRYIAVNYPITIDGNNKKITLIGHVGDKNGNYVLRLNEDSTVRNLTMDLSQTTGMLSGIAAKKGITMENCTLIGNGAAKTRAVMYGASNSVVSDIETTVTDCTFKNWAFGVSDNQNGKDSKAVTITDTTFDNASVLISASEQITFTGNTISDGSWCRIESYTGKNTGVPTLTVVANGNTMNRNENGWITNAVSYCDIQWEFYTFAPVVLIHADGKGYYHDSLKCAVEAAQDGDTVKMLESAELSEILTIDNAITLDGSNCTLTSTADRAINVNCAGQVEIKDLTIVGNANTERAVNVVQKAAELTLTNVTAENFKYTVNVAASSVGSNITVNGGKFSGYAALNITGEQTTVTVKDAELNSVGKDGNSNAFATIAVQANDATVKTTGGKIAATGTQQWLLVINGGAENATVVLDSELSYADAGIVNADVLVNRITVRDDYAAQVNKDGYMYEVNAEDATLIDLNGAVIAYNVQTNVYYGDLQVALDEAEEGQTVRPLVDIGTEKSLRSVLVWEGVILDLNGYDIYTNYFTAYGDVIDGAEGGYGYISTSKILVMGAQSYLPIYDTAVSGYRFYDYQLVNLGGRAAGTNAVKFGIRLLLTNQDGYAVLANTTDAKVSLHALVTWDSLGTDIDYQFQAATVQNYAQQVAAQVSSGQNITKAITLTITGLDKLPEGDSLMVTPHLESETMMETTGVQEVWAANS